MHFVNRYSTSRYISLMLGLGLVFKQQVE